MGTSTKSDLTMLIPSRGRPRNLNRLVQAVQKTAESVELFVGVARDDPYIADYRNLNLARWRDFDLCEFPHSDRSGMVERLNELFVFVDHAHRWDGRKFIGFMGDDVVPRTPGWDRQLCAAISAQGGGIAYPDDGIHQGALPTSVVMDVRMPRALGYIAPPQLQHLYVDNVWRDWGNMLERRTYLPDVLLEHMHPLAGKAPDDDTYAEQTDLWRADTAAYNHYVINNLRRDVLLMRKAMQ